ncbi:MAG: beta-L-arabinofuranosidase domain-containing protein [Acidobacteriaceae bacterium]
MLSRRGFLQSLGLAGAALYSRRPVFAEPEFSRTRLSEFGYGDVELAPGLAQTQFENTQSVLMSLNEDSLLKPWRLRAGLPAPGPDLGGWYDQTPGDKIGPNGHGFAPAHCFGQWISALARGYAVDRHPRTRARVAQLLDLYAPAISGRFYKNFRYPAYNYDKLVIGLLDAHRYAGLSNAYALLDRTTDAAQPYLPPHALDRGEPQRQWRVSVGDSTTDDYTWDESYTMPENLYLAAQLGAGERYRKMAGRYLLDKTYFDPLSENRNVLAGHHAYSFCNALSSAMECYIATGSRKHLRAGRNGFEMIATTQSFATGGWGPNESFSAPGSGALCASLTKTHSSFETPCGSYAHFKLTRYLLRVTGDGRYGDSMERVFYNTVLGAKRLEPDGHAFYYSDYNMHGRRVYHPSAWPCCAGTLPQIAADYRILSYFRDDDGIYVNLYQPSTLTWTAPDGAQMALSQTGNYPLDGKIAMHLQASRPSEFSVRLRIPTWSSAARPAAIRVNDALVSAPIHAGFATLRRRWKDGDRIEMDLAMPVRLEAIDPDHPGTVALVRGPLVLFAVTDNAPRVAREQLLAAQQVTGRPMWRVKTGSGVLQMVPFTELGEQPYTTYLRAV